MQVLHIFFGFSRKLKFKSDHRLKFRQLKIPFFHLLIFSKGVPQVCDGRIEQAFDYKWLIAHSIYFYYFLKFYFVASGTDAARSVFGPENPVWLFDNY